MSENERIDLTGRWTGMFSYPQFYPPNSFEATLLDADGLISGETEERDDDPLGAGSVLRAIIEGRREGDSISFIKIYEDADVGPEPIIYYGTIHADGDEIEGEWTHPGEWSGTFLMIRGAKASEAVEREVSEEV